MKRLTVLPLVLALAACSGPNVGSDVPETYEPYWDVRDHGELNVMPRNTNGLQFAAYCRIEQRFLSNWSDSRSSAASAAGEHRSKSEWHEVTTLWRQPKLPPGVRMDVANGAGHEDIHDDIPVRPRRSILNRRR